MLMVGWVERSETHHFQGIGGYNEVLPSYACYFL